MGRKAFEATVAFMLLFLAFLAALLISGCGGGNESKVSQDQPQDEASWDTGNPYGRPSANFEYTDEEVAKWTPSAQEVARCFEEDNYSGAIEVLYKNILESSPQDEDLFFRYAGADLPILFMDPNTIFKIYKDADRSGWTEDEQAAADLVVALTYNHGEFELVDESQYPKYPIGQYYKDIMDKYPDNRIADLAELYLASYYMRSLYYEKDLISWLEEIKADIEKKYQSSSYLTWATNCLAAAYRDSGDYAKALDEYYEILELPNLVSMHGTVHKAAEEEIKKIEEKNVTL